MWVRGSRPHAKGEAILEVNKEFKGSQVSFQLKLINETMIFMSGPHKFKFILKQ